MRFGLKAPFVAMLVVGLAITSPAYAVPIMIFGTVAGVILYSPSENWMVFILQTIYLILAAWAATFVLVMHVSS